MAYLKPVLAGLLASAIVYLAFTWLHWKPFPRQGTGRQAAMCHRCTGLCCIRQHLGTAIIAFGLYFSCFRNVSPRAVGTPQISITSTLVAGRTKTAFLHISACDINRKTWLELPAARKDRSRRSDD